ncbi:Polarized growth protein rax2 [Cyphellophora attinorum]|uniref:Polarized growth protein rax2 n=1 Tax=Cyphellophora attinorum TaxID=1664694 RepID=A0A0N0NMF5_9EURO|nr:Polarized growth protein rax2 [Phialophora attinorum]KPI40139.1 Polarized growth protein rax2 [Phialophora attinorum]
MRLPRLRSRAALLVGLLATQGASQSIPNPNIDLSDLGQVALTGDFDALSVYSFPGQFSQNGSNSILGYLPEGAYEVFASTDATIESMCPFIRRDGTFEGIIIGGNFTSLGGVQTRSIASYNPDTRVITPLVGLEGTVSAVLCDQQRETVYVAGAFDAANTTNAIAWTVDGAWQTLPFAGFDSPVTSVTKAPNGHIVFGGAFAGLGNTTTSSSQRERATQQIPLGPAGDITVGGASLTNAEEITCPTNGSDVAWKLNGKVGFWQADFGFGFEPTRLRLYNAGTKTFRFTALPINGILNFTHTVNGKEVNCDAGCTLQENPENGFEDFFFVNTVGMNSFRIDISDSYGDAGGLAGIQLFQSDVFSYAVSSFNEPKCGGPTGTLSTVTTTGPWFEMASFQSVSEYLAAVPGPNDIDNTEIVFEPSIQEKGNYSVMVYTPGCRADSSCSSRAVVNITGTLTTGAEQSFFTQISQTNDFDKYDTVYQGPIDMTTDSFRPSVSIKASGQLRTQRIVASRVKFGLVASTGGLNGLFDFNPDEVNVNPDTFGDSDINNAGTLLNQNAQIMALTTAGDVMFAGGSFTDDRFQNIMSFTSEGNATSLADGGLNSAVLDFFVLDNTLYVGGNFTGTSTGNQQGLSNVAAYDVSGRQWSALGAGLNGAVEYVAPVPVNISTTETQLAIAFSGDFSQISQSGSDPAIDVQGLAIWVPSAKNWLQRTNAPQHVLNGQLTAGTTLPNNTWMGAGSLASLGQALHGAAGMSSSQGRVSLSSLPIEIEADESASSLRKRALMANQNVTGVVEGITYEPSGANVTIFGGHFTAQGQNGAEIQNLLFINGSNNNAVSGLPSGVDDNSTFVALESHENLLFAGGRVTGELGQRTISGVLIYDMNTANYASIQPAGLVGPNVTVNDIKVQPDTASVYVGGAFTGTSQDLACPAVCMYDTTTNQWNPVGSGLQGTVAQLFWNNNKQMFAVGNLTLGGNTTSMVQYDPDKQEWTQIMNDAIPGPISAFTAVTEDGKQLWVSGTASNGSTFLINLDDGQSNVVEGLLSSGTVIRGLSVVDSFNDHSGNDFLAQSEMLVILGQLNITGFGSASAATFNGTQMVPLVLASKSDGSAGSVSGLAASRPRAPRSESNRRSIGITVLVALCAALGTIFLIVLLGLLLNRIQRRRAGYNQIPSMPYTDKNANLNRVPPESLFGSLGQRTGAAPRV